MRFLTSTRSPADHFVSGALIAGIGTLSLNLGEQNPQNLIKKTAKMALVGGVTTATAIHASNCIANARYLNAAVSVATAVGALLVINNLSKENKE